MRRLPEKINCGQLYNFTVDHVIHKFEDGTFKLPPFQRPAVWKEKQQIKFIESLILGLPIGTYTYHRNDHRGETDGWIIDGQQRLTSIKRYVNSEFKVFGWAWRDLDLSERRHVGNSVFSAHQLQDLTKEELLDRYIALNYSGTAHTEADKRKAMKFRTKGKL